MISNINITLNSEQKTKIIIGENILFSLPCYLQDLAPTSLIIIIDNNILEQYRHNLEEIFDRTRLYYNYFIINNGELDKCTSIIERFALFLSEDGQEFDKKSVVISIGGGVISDIAGLLSSIFYRGIKLVCLPTTLLAQVDGAVGGKNGINSILGKNTIGTIYQPDIICVDTCFLQTLSDEKFFSAIPEILKYGILYSRDFLIEIIENKDKIINRDRDFILKLIKKSINFKVNVVKHDQFDNNLRKYLNLGHSFGHALEKHFLDNKRSILHGQAVAVGIIFILDLSIDLGYDLSEERKLIAEFFRALQIKTEIYDFISREDIKEIIQLMKRDKKNIGGKYNLIIVEDIAKCRMQKVNEEAILSIMANKVAA